MMLSVFCSGITIQQALNSGFDFIADLHLPADTEDVIGDFQIVTLKRFCQNRNFVVFHYCWAISVFSEIKEAGERRFPTKVSCWT